MLGYEEKCLPVLAVGPSTTNDDPLDSLHPDGEQAKSDRDEH